MCLIKVFSVRKGISVCWQKDDIKKKVVTELAEIQEILLQYHSNPMGEHSGINNTLSKISQYYMWNDMKEDVVEYVSMISDTYTLSV